MSLALPLEGTPARDALDIQHLVDVTISREFSTLSDSRQAARKSFGPGILRVNTLTLMADGSLKLLSWGPRLGRKVLWNFGRV